MFSTPVRLSITLGLLLAALAPAQELSTDDVSRARPATSPLLSVPGGATIEAAFNREPALAKALTGADSPVMRYFLWKFLPAEERDAVSKKLEATPGTEKVPALLAGDDQYRWDRGYVFAPEVRAAVQAATGLPAEAFDADGRIVPSAAVIQAQDKLAQAVFAYYSARQSDPFAGQPPKFELVTGRQSAAADRIDQIRERAQATAPVVLDQGVRAKVRAAKADPAALARLAKRSKTPVPGVAEAERRLAWARGVLEAKHLLDDGGTQGVGDLMGGGIFDPLVFRALDTVHRYALEGEPLLPGATFPRTSNNVRVLFGHRSEELMAIYAEVEKMMDTATRAIWVDLFYLGGSMNEEPGKDNMGVRMLRYLQKRQSQGIEVRFILSPHGTGFTPKDTFDAAIKMGAKTYNLAALPGGIPTKVDHDKLIVIDHGRAAMVGTMNFDVNAHGWGGHHETVSLVRGPAAAILAWSHLTNWRLAGGADSPADDDLVQKAMAQDPGAPGPDETQAPVWVTLTQPALENTAERLLDWIGALGRGDELRVWMFQFGDRATVDALVAAVKRGVNLRMLCDPLSGPVPQVPFLPNLAAYAPLTDAFAAGGAGAIHLLDRDASNTYMHSKVAVFGRDRFTLGSTNWTFVGLRRNAELSIWVESEALAAKLIERFETEWKMTEGPKAFFPTLEAYRAARPGYGNVDRAFLDRAARMLDEFF